VAVTHAVLGKGWDDLQNGLLGAPLTSLVFTDTIQPVDEKIKKLKEKMEVTIVSVAEMFAQAIQEIAIGGSIGRIFEEWESKLHQMGES
jgi:phosphoribosylpyrophosphate synthetase